MPSSCVQSCCVKLNHMGVGHRRQALRPAARPEGPRRPKATLGAPRQLRHGRHTEHHRAAGGRRGQHPSRAAERAEAPAGRGTQTAQQLLQTLLRKNVSLSEPSGDEPPAGLGHRDEFAVKPFAPGLRSAGRSHGWVAASHYPTDVNWLLTVTTNSYY